MNKKSTLGINEMYDESVDIHAAERQSTVAPSDVQGRVAAMNQGWTNYLCNQLGLDLDTFQVAQGTLGLQSADSSGLFNMANGIPPYSATNFFNASAGVDRNDAYAALLNCLQSTTQGGMQAALGDKYPAWMLFKQSEYMRFTSVEQMFNAFAMGNLNTTQTSAGRSVLAKAKNDPYLKALNSVYDHEYYQTFVTSAGASYDLPIYSGTHEAAVRAIRNGASKSISFSTSQMDSSSHSTTVSGGMSGFYNIFFGGTRGTYNDLSSRAAWSEMVIEGTIGSYATLVTEAADWYNGDMVSRAFNAKDDFTIWDPMSNLGDWESFFNPQTGRLARRTAQLILVDGLDVTVTSRAAYSASDITKLSTSARFGVWPFFSSTASLHTESRYQLNADSSMSWTLKIPKGKISILGATVESAPN